MKHKWKFISLFVGLFVVSFVSVVYAASKDSYKSWTVFRTVVATETTQLTASTQQTAPDPGEDGTVNVMQEFDRNSKDIQVGAVQIEYLGTAAADLTLAWTVWAYKSVDDPAEFVANGTATTGLTETGVTNEFYCDTIVITAQGWYKSVLVVSGAPTAIISGGGISKLVFDSCDYPLFKIVIRDIGGGGAEAATAGAKIASFI